MSFYPGKQILPYQMWIGSKQDSANGTAARRHGISLIINCTRDIPFKVKNVERYKVPVDDHSDEAGTFLAYLPGAVQRIDEHLTTRGGGVLGHCYAGISRSASVVAA